MYIAVAIKLAVACDAGLPVITNESECPHMGKRELSSVWLIGLTRRSLVIPGRTGIDCYP